MENEPGMDAVDGTDKKQASSSDAEPKDGDSKRNDFKVLYEGLEKKCNLITNGQERRDFRKKLWHLYRTDNEAFKNNMGTGPTSSSDAVKQPSARQHNPQNEAEDSLHVRVPSELSGSPPCLPCSLKGREACSIQQAEFVQAVRCQRCRRNGEAYCIRQQKNMVPPGDADYDDDGCTPLNLERAGHDEEYLARHVYCHDNILQRDKIRLCAVTRELLAQYCHQEEEKGVCDTSQLPPPHAFRSSGWTVATLQPMALPMWHRNDDPTNRRDPDFCPRTRAAHLAEVRARWEASGG